MKKFFALFLALVLSLGLFAACDDGTPSPSPEHNSYTVTVSCGEGGSYSLSHENPVPENTKVTLTVSPDEGYAVEEVLFGGSKIGLTDNKYSFTVTADVSISITFKAESAEPPAPQSCTVTVTCGTGGTYALSPASDFHVGDKVTLTLSPYSGYAAGEVKVNGAPAVLDGNVCEFTLEGDTDVEISFDQIPSHSVTVSCGAGGSYALSPNRSSYYEGTEVTLTVTANEHFAVDTVKLNGTDVLLNEENAYTFTVTEATVIEITFEDTRYKKVTVNCGQGGSYSLSPEGPLYYEGTDVTLTVTPETGYRVGKVLVDGAEVTLADGSYTFTVNQPTTVEINFVLMEDVFPADVCGVWNPFLALGTLGETITVNQDTILFGGKECEVKETDGALSFTYTDDEGTSFVYTPSYRLIREGLYLFSISYTDLSDNSTATAYYLKEGLDYYTYSYPAEFIGEWETQSGTALAVSVTETELMVGLSRAIVMNYDETSKTLTMMTAGGIFTLQRSGGSLLYTRTTDDGDVELRLSKVVGATPVLIPQYAGTYTSKDGKNILVVNEDGTAKYSTDSGTSYHDAVFCPADKFGLQKNAFTINYGQLTMNADFLTDVGLGIRVWIRQGSKTGVELFASDYREPYLTVEVDCGEHGSYTLSPQQEEYHAGDKVTITITADEGYVFDTVERLDMYGQWTRSYPSNNKTFTVTITITESMIQNYADVGYKYAYKVTFKADPAQQA